MMTKSAADQTSWMHFCGLVVFGLALLLALVVFNKSRERGLQKQRQQECCQHNLYDLYLAAKSLADRHDGRWPASMTELAGAIPPKSMDIFVCPASDDLKPELRDQLGLPGYCSYQLLPVSPSGGMRAPLLRETVPHHDGKRWIIFTDRSSELTQ